MATLSQTTIGNIFDLQKFKLPDGSPLQNVVNALAEKDDFSRFLPAFPSNNGLTHHSLRTISLPTGYRVDVGGSWKASKSAHEPIVEDLVTIRSAYKAPTDTFTQESETVGRALLNSAKIDHIMTINQGANNIILNGASTRAQDVIVGLEQRTPWATHDAKFTFNVGGTGNDLRSAWLIKPGVDTCHFLYNANHPTLGVEMEEKGEWLEEGLGSLNDEHRWNIWIEFMITKGIFIRDQRAVKRICNVPCGVSDLPGADLITQVIEASIINAPTGGTITVTEANGTKNDLASPWILFCDERLYAKLVVAANSELKVYTSEENIYQTKLPMIGDNIIIARWDALNKVIGSGEGTVGAA
jgi:hypothetical protein